METKKIAIACFVGAAIGTVIALSVAPLFWWLGMLAGFGAGYLCYDLKEVREKAPIAWTAARKGSRYSLDWLKRPHPFLCLYLMTIPALVSVSVKLLPWREDLLFREKIVFAFILGAISTFMITMIVAILVEKEAERKRCFWQPSLSRIWTNKEITAMIEKGYTQICPNYRNIYGLLLTGLKHLVWGAIENTPKVLKGIGIELFYILRFLLWDLWVFMARFFWILLKLIHSQKRVLCGIDSAIGVFVTYLLLGTKAVTPGQQVMVVICGGIIGAVVGVLNYEIISKRLLHLAPVENDV